MHVDTAESWAEVADAPRYLVSDHGRVRSLPCVRKGGRVLRPWINNGDGYFSVDIERRTRQVHHLVLESFVGPRPAGMYGCHNDGNPGNNNLSNLRWDTPQSNCADKMRHGRHRQANQTRCKRGHLLVTPNLCPDALRSGRRSCLACQRTRNMFNQRRRRGLPDLDMQQVSDARFVELMDGLPGQRDARDASGRFVLFAR